MTEIEEDMSVNIRQPGIQSRQLNEIRDQLNHNVLISHILNIKISLETQNGDVLRKLIKKKICDVPLSENVDHNGSLFPVAIKWVMPNAGSTSAYYYAVNLPYVDSIVASHTKIALGNICDSIRAMYPEFGLDWGITYLISKPLQYLAPIPAENLIRGLALNDDEHVED
jgi:RNA-binding protein YhbY